MKKKCLYCNKRQVSLFGKYDPDSNICTTCLVVMERKSSEPVQGEWTRHSKAELEAHSKDVLQPLKKDGTVNKDFVRAHGTKALEKELKVTAKEIHENIEKYG